MYLATLIPLSGPPQVIFDATKFPNPDMCADGFQPNIERQFQQTPLVRSANPFVADRFNQLQKWDFTVTHSFTTYLACQDFIGARAGIARTGEVMLVTRTSQATFTRYLWGATLRLIPCAAHWGLSCQYRYTLYFTNYSLVP